MNSDFYDSFINSAQTFRFVVWPRIQLYCDAGELYHIESFEQDEITKKFDILAGIDAWQIIPDTGIRGIASRVQPIKTQNYKTPWNTFTTRYKIPNGCKTEFAKRLHAFQHPEEGLLTPHFTIQSYVNHPEGKEPDEVLTAGVISTRDLILHIQECYVEKKKWPYELRHEAGLDYRALWDEYGCRIKRCYKETNRADKNEFIVSQWAHLKLCDISIIKIDFRNTPQNNKILAGQLNLMFVD